MPNQTFPTRLLAHTTTAALSLACRLSVLASCSCKEKRPNFVDTHQENNSNDKSGSMSPDGESRSSLMALPRVPVPCFPTLSFRLFSFLARFPCSPPLLLCEPSPSIRELSSQLLFLSPLSSESIGDMKTYLKND